VLCLAVVLLAAAWLSNQLIGPLRALTTGVARFGQGDYGARVRVRTADEIGRLCAAFNEMAGDIAAKTSALDAKNRENEDLLLNILPPQIADRLRGGEQSIADGFASVSVMFADIVGFTDLSSRMPPHELVGLLNGLFTRFDQAAQELGVEKIKTVGDAYMAVCGLPIEIPDHVERMVQMAVRLVHITREHALLHNVPLQLRVGIHAGNVVAGVIGRTKYIYDLWGDTVNLASRMESGGLAGAIQVTRPVYEKVRDKYPFEARGLIQVRGRGEIEAWFLKLVDSPAP
jgi:class 3 adenylate cyclase